MLCISSLHFSPANTAAAAINPEINFQGKLDNPDGTNVTDGTYSVVFSIYSTASGGTALWTETQSVSVSDGIFQVDLGSVTPLPGTINFDSSNLYLGIKVGSDAEMTPRIQFTSVPQAFDSSELGGLSSSDFGQLAANQTFTGSNLFKTSSNSSTAFQIQGSGGAEVLDADTQNSRLGVGTSAPGNLLSVGTLTTAASGFQLAVSTGSATGSGILVQNVSGQSSGYAFELQDSTGTPLASIDYQGNLVVQGATVDGSAVCTQATGCGGGAAGYVDLAPSSAQTDSSTNSSIFINKTGASGNLLQLQNNGANVFTVSNTGDTLLQPSIDSTSAFQIQNAEGTDTLLNADTTNDSLTVTGANGVDGSNTASLGDSPAAVAISGNYAYVLDSSADTMEVFDISNPADLTQVGGTIATGGDPTAIAISGNYAYVLNGNDNTMEIFDISNPAAVTQVGSDVTTGNYPNAIAISGNYAYVINNGDDTLETFDISNPASVSQVGSDAATDGNPTAIVISGNYAYVTDAEVGTLQAFDISNPAAVTEAGSYDSLVAGSVALAVSGNYVYVFTTLGTDEIQVLDVSNPASITEVDSGVSTNGGTAVAISGNYAYVAAGYDGTLQAFDISNPADVTQVNSGTAPTVSDYSSGIAIAGNYAYVVAPGTNNDVPGTFQSFNISNPVHISQPKSAVALQVSGAARFQNTVNSTNAFQIQDAAGSNLFTADTENDTIVIKGGNGGETTYTGQVGEGVATAGDSEDMAVSGNYAYVVDWSADAMQVFDISNPASITQVGSNIPTGDGSSDITISGNYAYVTNDNSNTLQIFDISNPASVTQVGSDITTDTGPEAVAISGNYAYVTSDADVLQVFDISNPASVTQVGSNVATGSCPDRITITGTDAYVLNTCDSTLQSFDISNPASVSLLDTFSVPDFNNDYGDIAVSGNYLYVANESANAVQSFDISNPASITEADSVTLSGGSSDWTLAIVGNSLYAAGAGSLEVFDISDPTAITQTSSDNLGDLGGVDTDITVSGNYVYLVFNEELDAFDISNPSAFGQSIYAPGALQVDGAAAFQNTTDTTSAFRVQNAEGATLLNVDTEDSLINIAADTTIQDNSSTALQVQDTSGNDVVNVDTLDHTLDVSGMPVNSVGDNLITYDDFSDTTYWTASTVYGNGTWTLGPNSAAFSDATADIGELETSQFYATPGQWYAFSFTLSGITSSSDCVTIYLNEDYNSSVSECGDGTYAGFVQAGSSSPTVELETGYGFVGTISNVTVEPVTNSLSDSPLTITSSPSVQANGLGVEMNTDTDFTNAADWSATPSGDWTLTSSSAAYTNSAGSDVLLDKQATILPNQEYQVTLTVSGVTNGTIWCIGPTNFPGCDTQLQINSDGTYTADIQGFSGNQQLEFAPLAGTGTITSVSLKLLVTATYTTPALTVQDSSGDQLLQVRAPDSSSVFIGMNSGAAYDTGNVYGSTDSNDTALGDQALQDTTTGSYNTAVGNEALQANTTGSGNTALGYDTLYNNETGADITAVGTDANVGSDGLQNATAIGYEAEVNESNALVLGCVNGTNGCSLTTSVGIGTTTPTAELNVVGTTGTFLPTSTSTTDNSGGTTTPGLAASWYNSTSTDNDYETPGNGTLAYSGTDGPINWEDLTTTAPPGVNTQYINATWTGWVKADYTGTYTFTTASDDGSRLYLGGAEIVNNWGSHGVEYVNGNVNLTANTWYPITIQYFQGNGGASIDVLWTDPTGNYEDIPLANLSSTEPDGTVYNGGFAQSASTAIQAASGQTGDLLDLQNSSGALAAEFTSTGELQGGDVYGSNTAGTDLLLAGGQGTGTGVGGDIDLQIAAPGSSGSTANSLTTVMSLNGSTGAATFQNAVDSINAFQIQDAAGSSLFDVNTTAPNGGTVANIDVSAQNNYVAGLNISVVSNGIQGTTGETINNTGGGYAEQGLVVTSDGQGIAINADGASINTNASYNHDGLLVGSNGSTSIQAIQNGSSSALNLYSFNTGSQNDSIELGRGEGSYSSIGLAQAGDMLGGIGFAANTETEDWANTGMTNAASIESYLTSSSATAGNLEFKTSNGTSMTAAETLGSNGSATFQNNTNSTTGFQVQNAAGASVLNLDTTNQTLTVKGQGVNLNDDIGSTLGGKSNYGPNFSTISGHYMYVVSGYGSSSILQIFDISNPDSPTLVGSAATDANPNGVAVSGNYAYVVNTDSNTMQVFSIADPSSPVLTYPGTVTTGARPSSVAVSGNYAYVADDSGLQVFDISTPYSPSLAATVATISSGWNVVAVSGNYAYVGAESYGLQVFDISTPSSPTSVGSVATNSNAWFPSIAVSGNYVYAADYDDDVLDVFNVSTPSSPTLAGSAATGYNTTAVAVSGTNAYVTNYDSNTLQVFDVSTPGSPVLTGSVATDQYPQYVAVSGNYAYVINQNGGEGLQTFNISNPASPSLDAGSAVAANGPSFVTTAGNYMYVADQYADTLQIFSISTPASPTSVGSVATSSEPLSIAVSGNYAYVVESNTMQIFDISTPSSPTLTGSIALSGGDQGANSIFVSGNYAYVVTQSETSPYPGVLQVFNVSTPSAPTQADAVTLPAEEWSDSVHIAVSGNYLYALNGDPSDEMLVFDISNPASVTQVGSGISTNDSANGGITISGNYAYVAGGPNNVGVPGTIQIFDISNPASVTQVGSVSAESSPSGITVSGNYAYVVNGSSNDVQAFNVSNPAAPTVVGSIPVGPDGSPNSIAVSGNYAYVADNQSDIVQVFNTSQMIGAMSNTFVLQDASGDNIDAFDASGNLTIAPVNDSAAALQVKDASGATLFDVDTTDGVVGIGGTPSSNGAALQVTGTLSVSQLATYNGDTVLCYDSSDGYLAACSSSAGNGSYIYNASSLQTAANIDIQSSSAGTATVQLEDVASQTADLLDLEDSSGTVMDSFGANGSVTFKNNTNSTTALQVQNTSNDTVLGVDTSNDVVSVGGTLNLVPTGSGTSGVIDLNGSAIISVGGGDIGHGSGINLASGETLQGSSAGNVQLGNNNYGDGALSTGTGNVAIGSAGLFGDSTGSNNVAIGAYQALYNNTTGSNNIALNRSLVNNTTGSDNIALGDNALDTNTTGSNDVGIGANADVLFNNLSNATAIGTSVGSANTTALGGQVVIGSHFSDSTANLLQAGAQTYSTGTISQSGSTTLTGTGTTFQPGMVGGTIYYSDGTSNTITGYTSATQLTTSSSTTESGSYDIIWGGFNVSGTGTAVLQSTTNSASAFQIQNAAGTSLLTGDTTNMQINVGGAVNIGSLGGNRLFSDGFESGNFNLWTSATNATIVTSPVHEGKYAAEISPAANTSALGTYITSSSTVYERAWVYVSSQSSSNALLMQLFITPNVTNWSVIRTSSGSLELTHGGSVVGTGGTLATGGWHELELRITVGSGSGVDQVWLDGTQTINLSGQSNGTSGINGIQLGDDSGSGTFTAYFDDLSVDTSDPGVASSSLNVQDSLHVGGTSSFGNDVLIQSTSNSTSALKVQDSAGNTQFNVDTQNGLVSSGDAGYGVKFMTHQAVTPATGSSVTSSDMTVSGGDPVIILNIGLSSSSATVSSVSWSLGSGTPYQVKTVRNGTTYIAVWAIPAPTAGSGTYTVHFSTSVPYQVDGQVFEGVDQTTPAPTGDAVSTTGGEVGTLSLTPTNVANNEAVSAVSANTVAGDSTGMWPATTYDDSTTAVNISSGYSTDIGDPIDGYFNTDSGQESAMVAIRLQASSTPSGNAVMNVSSNDPWYAVTIQDADASNVLNVDTYDHTLSVDSAPETIAYGNNLVTDDFANTTDWTTTDTSNWTLATNSAAYAGYSDTLIENQYTPPWGDTYMASVTLSGAGSADCVGIDVGNDWSDWYCGDGTYTLPMTSSGQGTAGVTVENQDGDAFTGTISNFSLEQVTNFKNSPTLVVNNSSSQPVLEVRTTADQGTLLMGYNAGASLVGGVDNTAVGSWALQDDGSGEDNTALGAAALSSSISGWSNTAIGANSLSNNQVGGANVAVGAGTLSTGGWGDDNTAVGYNALSNDNGLEGETAIGYEALQNDSGGGGGEDVAVGYEALKNNNSGEHNNALGYRALEYANGAYDNNAFGNAALNADTSGTDNTAIGEWALGTIATGIGNTGVGSGAGDGDGWAGNGTTAGNDNTFLGAWTDGFNSVGSGSLQNATAIGVFSEVNESNAMVLGCVNGTNGCSAATDVGIATTEPGNLLSVGALTTAASTFQIAVSTGSTTNSGIVVQNVASQSAGYAFQLQSSTGTSLASINYQGNLTVQSATVSGSLTVSGAATAQDFAATGLTGATASSRYVGATTSGAPTSGTFQKGDYVVSQSGVIYICTVAGSPGTWVSTSGMLARTELTSGSWSTNGNLSGVTITFVAPPSGRVKLESTMTSNIASSYIEVGFTNSSGGAFVTNMPTVWDSRGSSGTQYPTINALDVATGLTPGTSYTLNMYIQAGAAWTVGAGTWSPGGTGVPLTIEAYAD